MKRADILLVVVVLVVFTAGITSAAHWHLLGWRPTSTIYAPPLMRCTAAESDGAWRCDADKRSWWCTEDGCDLVSEERMREDWELRAKEYEHE